MANGDVVDLRHALIDIALGVLVIIGLDLGIRQRIGRLAVQHVLIIVHRRIIRQQIVVIDLGRDALAEVQLQIGVDIVIAVVRRALGKAALRVQHVLDGLGLRLRQLIARLLRRQIQGADLGEVVRGARQEILLPRSAARGVLQGQRLRVVQTQHGGIGAIVVHELVEFHPVVDLQVGVRQAVARRVARNDRAHLHVAGLRRARGIGGVVRDGVLAEIIGVDQIGRLAVGRRDLLARFERLVCDGLGRAVRCLSRLRLRGLRPGRVILAARDEQDAGRDGRHESQRRQENGNLCALGHAGLLFRGLIFLRLRLRDRRGFRFGLRGRLRLGRGHFQFLVFVVFQIHNVSRFPNDAPIISHHTGLFNAFSRRGVNFLSTFARRAARRARP